MPIPFGHQALHSRYRFEGNLILETPLRLSSGRASNVTDAPLMRNRGGIPYIPGSSLRGAIRSAVERLISGVGAAAGLKSCTLFSDDDCNEQARTFQQSGDKTDKDLADFAEKELCDVCKLFGATIYASRLVIEDVYPQPQGQLQDKSVLRDGVGIDRDTGVAHENVKFDYEVLEPGPIFGFRMQSENMTEQDLKLINLILGLLKQGMHVGGKQAAGLGKIKLDEQSLIVSGFENPQQMWQAFMAGEDPHKVLAWKEAVTC